MKKPFVKITGLLLAGIMCLAGCTVSAPQPDVSASPGRPAVFPEITPQPTAQPQPRPELPEQLLQDGKIKVYIEEEDRIEEMDPEEYIACVVAGEMDNAWPLEALKAQAILARTFLYQFLVNKEHSSLEPEADISTSTAESQAFNAEAVNDLVKQAVSETRGMVAAYGGKYIKAWFHACSGGVTATAEDGLGYTKEPTPYIVSVKSDESAAPETHTGWQAEFTAGEVKEALKAIGVSAEELAPVELKDIGPSGRCITVSFGGTPASAAELRMALDPKKFRSTLITSIVWEDDVLKVQGKGFGHGVGMSQWGAYSMAKNGSTAQQILEHYYKDIDICQVGE